MVPAEYGYAGIIVALISLLTKLWLDSGKRTDSIVEAFKENAVASTKLSLSIDANTKITEETKVAAYEHNKSITVLISKVIGRRK